MNLSIDNVVANNTKILKATVSKTAMQGVLVAVGATVAATLAVTFVADSSLTLNGIISAQSSNPVLWIMDTLPFIFGYLGQYSSYMIAHEASLMVMQQTDELRMHANQLERQVTFATTHDPLTELPNRALFYDRLERAINAVTANGATLVVLLVAIENLKEIQDTLGPANVDLILKQLAIRLQSWANNKDSVARIDSHTFAILIGEGAPRKAEAERAAHNLQKVLEPPFLVNHLKLTLHSSIGIVIAPDHGDDADTLLQRAGVTLYVASKSTKGFSIYSATMEEHSPHRLTLMGDLRRAIERNELDLYYQPKVCIADGLPQGVEALLRWKHPLHGFIAPEEFIDLAERTRLIRPLTNWVMERAFRDCTAWRSDGLPFNVSINLSAKDLNDPDLPDIITGIMAKTAVKAEWIMFEITESSIMVDPARALNVLERIRGMGFNLSIDDFGTGYSSLAYLRKLPVMEIKIDRSFVMDMLESENDAVIVHATINLAHNLGLKVTAEGVETREVLQALQGFGCDMVQGYFLSPPVPFPQLKPWFIASTSIEHLALYSR